MSKNIRKELMGWILIIVIAVIVAVFINKVVIIKVKIPSGSMNDTIMVGDKVITFRLAYLFNEPKRGDIIVFPFPDNENENYIKRIIGLPGEKIEGINGLVYIDGEPLEESYVKETLDDDFGPYEVPKGCYFMMGDNRNDSADSRFWSDKFLHRKKILGKAILKYPKLKVLK